MNETAMGQKLKQKNNVWPNSIPTDSLTIADCKGIKPKLHENTLLMTFIKEYSHGEH